MSVPEIPASHLPDAYCPYCGVSVHPILLQTDVRAWREGYSDRYVSFCLVRCTRKDCGLTFYLTVSGTYSPSDGRLFDIKLTGVWPPSVKAIDKRIPKDVATDFRQAYKCWMTDMIRAGTLILRRCLENACLTAGATEDRLEVMIDELAAKGVLHPINVKSAHKTRIIGNFTAHLVREITSEELDKTLILTEKILEDLFVTPELQKEIDTSRPSKARAAENS